MANALSKSALLLCRLIFNFTPVALNARFTALAAIYNAFFLALSLVFSSSFSLFNSLSIDSVVSYFNMFLGSNVGSSCIAVSTAVSSPFATLSRPSLVILSTRYALVILGLSSDSSPLEFSHLPFRNTKSPSIIVL